MRAVVVALLLANLAFFAWTQGALDGVLGARLRSDREPERLARQVRPQAVHVLAPAEAASALAAGAPAASAVSAGPPACLQAGPFALGDIDAAEAALQLLDPPLSTGAGGNWARVPMASAPSWIVYMGRYASAESLQKKLAELQRYRGLSIEELREPPALVPGLSLGRYAAQTDADAALAALTQRGIHTARVLPLGSDSQGVGLRFEHADPAVQQRLLALAEPAFKGHAFEACPADTAASDAAGASAPR